MSLSQGNRYISAIDDEKRQGISNLDIMNSLYGMQVVSIADSSQEPDSIQHHASLTSLQQDKIDTLQISYNELLDKYQRKNADTHMKVKKGNSSRKHYAELKYINNSLINLGNDFLGEVSKIQTDDKSLQRKVNNQRDEMQRQIGYLHNSGNSHEKYRPPGIVGYHIMSLAILSVLTGSLVYHLFYKRK